MNFDELAETGRFDLHGTVRADESLGTVAIYVKIGPDSWLAVYVNPYRVDDAPASRFVSDKLAAMHSIVFSPKTVGEQHG